MSGVDEVLSKVAAGLEERKRARKVKWQALVKAICDEKPPSPEIVEAALAECGQSVDELKKACDSFRERLRLKGKIDAYEAAKVELATIEKKLKAAVAELNAAKEKCRQACEPLTARRGEIERLQLDASGARQKLRRTIDPQLAAELATAREKRGTINKEIDEQKNIAGRYRTQAAKFDEKLAELEAARYQLGEEPLRQKRIQDAKVQAQSLRESARNIETEKLPNLSRELGEIDAQVAKLEAQQFEP